MLNKAVIGVFLIVAPELELIIKKEDIVMLALKNILKKEEGKAGGCILDNFNLQMSENEYMEIVSDDHLALEALVRIISLIDRDFQGEYFLNGIAIHQLSAEETEKVRIANVGLVIRELNLINELTVAENLELPIVYQSPATSQKRLVVDMLKKFNLMHRKSHFPSGLSPLTKIKTAIAQALILSPKLLILEYDRHEISSDDRLNLNNLLQTLNEEGLAILEFTHGKASESFALRKLRLKHGQVLST